MKTARPSRTRSEGAFTLIELLVVVALISVIAAVTFPNFYPAIAFTQLERAAKHMANYGRGVMAEAVMLQQDITVRIDLKAQEMSAVRWAVPEPEQPADAYGQMPEDMLGMLGSMRDMAPEMAERFGARGTSPRMLPGGASDFDRYMATFEDFGEVPEGFDSAAADKQMSDKFDAFARRATMARAKNVKHEDFLEEIDLFEGYEFQLDESNQPVEMELDNPLFQRAKITEGVYLESVEVDGAAHNKGVVEIELSPLGLASTVVFYFVNEDGDYYTVVWDPLLGGAKSYRGKLSFS
ncbi:MAG: type II secretion system protein [Candidatus Hydrogenedentes bacterium]|nr:type II secretion system protein [Candidatus Hydrogenedentota bacterium]